ncbi:hypothetical protein VNI00_000634 [Paramarasmius palmivorus]|uniref:F-box domain-containing protein n=1 Tax=Paramarasmius palmivorus TaxID=297713 RepID=A0AAW0E608_9AGAR
MNPDQYPCEIWLQIFRLACVDDGTTGRSLSLVCRFFREVSKEVKLQSLAIFGVEEMIQFSEILETLPEQDRKVRHLFMSTEIASMRHRHDASPRFERTQPYELDRDRYEYAVRVWGRLLSDLSTSLDTLYVFAIRLARSSLLAPVTLSCLTELHIAGPFPACYDMNPIPTFPILSHLHLSGFHGFPIDVFRSIVSQAPRLVGLHLKPAQFSRNFCNDLLAVFQPKRNPSHSKSGSSNSSGCTKSKTGAAPVCMPSTFQRVYVTEPSGVDDATSIHKESVHRLRLLSSKPSSKLVLAPPAPLLSLDAALEQWEAMIRLRVMG